MGAFIVFFWEFFFNWRQNCPTLIKQCEKSWMIIFDGQLIVHNVVNAWIPKVQHCLVIQLLKWEKWEKNKKSIFGQSWERMKNVLMTKVVLSLCASQEKKIPSKNIKVWKKIDKSIFTFQIAAISAFFTLNKQKWNTWYISPRSMTMSSFSTIHLKLTKWECL